MTTPSPHIQMYLCFDKSTHWTKNSTELSPLEEFAANKSLPLSLLCPLYTDELQLLIDLLSLVGQIGWTGFSMDKLHACSIRSN